MVIAVKVIFRCGHRATYKCDLFPEGVVPAQGLAFVVPTGPAAGEDIAVLLASSEEPYHIHHDLVAQPSVLRMATPADTQRWHNLRRAETELRCLLGLAFRAVGEEGQGVARVWLQLDHSLATVIYTGPQMVSVDAILAAATPHLPSPFNSQEPPLRFAFRWCPDGADPMRPIVPPHLEQEEEKTSRSGCTQKKSIDPCLVVAQTSLASEPKKGGTKVDCYNVRGHKRGKEAQATKSSHTTTAHKNTTDKGSLGEAMPRLGAQKELAAM